MYILISETAISEFVDWLQALPRLKQRRESLQHGHQVSTIWIAITEDGSDLSVDDITNHDKINTNWLTPMLQKKAPGTIRSYIGSLVLFMDYLTMSGQHPNSTQKCQTCKEVMKAYSQALRRKIRVRRTLVETEEIGTFARLIAYVCTFFRFSTLNLLVNIVI